MHTQELLEKHLAVEPRTTQAVFIAATASITGDVELGARTSIWHGAVLRGDINAIRVGAGSNVQDNAVIHVSDIYAAEIGEEVVIGHLACVHACRIGDGALIGMHSVVLDGAEVGDEAIVAAGAVVPPGMKIPAGMMAVGVPARIVRALSAEERRGQRELAGKYVEVATVTAAKFSNRH